MSYSECVTCKRLVRDIDDPTGLEPGTPLTLPKHGCPDPRPRRGPLVSDREEFRREVALQALLVFLECEGDREDKVRAAVEYATLLCAELDRTEAS